MAFHNIYYCFKSVGNGNDNQSELSCIYACSTTNEIQESHGLEGGGGGGMTETHNILYTPACGISSAG